MGQINLQPGGILGFQCRDVISDTINVFTGALPGWGIHHVGILSSCSVGFSQPKLLLYESTTSERPPNIFTGKPNTGVGARTVDCTLDYFAKRGTTIYYYALRSPLYSHEEQRLDAWLRSKIGLPYYMDGAIGAGGGFIHRSLERALRPENLSSFFCSAMCIGGLSYINRVNTDNIDSWSPNKLVRFLVKVGICDRPQLLLPASSS